MKNFILNGAMRFDQNKEGGIYYSDPNTEVYSLDQWRFSGGTSGDGRFTMQRVPISYNFYGFDYILQAATTAQQTVLNATDNMHIEYPIEGCNITPWEFGTVDAKNITVSFRFIATIAGEFSFTLMNGQNTRSYVTSFVYDTASVPQYITITIPGDQSGTWVTDECTFGAKFLWTLGVGSTATTSTADEWQSAAYWNKDGSTQIIQYAPNTCMYIVGFQVELGDTATPFEFLTYTEELLLLQRYYYKTFPHGVEVGTGKGANGALTYKAQNPGASSSGAQFFQPVSMCAVNAPVTFYNPVNNNSQWYNQSLGIDSGNSILANQSDNKGFVVNTQSSADTVGSSLSIHMVINSRLGGS
jgi:hypothetical protein